MVLIEKRGWGAWVPILGLLVVVAATVDKLEEQAWLLKEA
jgi:hypothetical protein